MKFAEFQDLREKTIRDRPDVLDCGATNLYSLLGRLIPVATSASQRTVHRCHLASEWCERFNFPPEASRRALVSCGVRDSLALLFRYYAANNARLWLPADNYPVYGDLARAAGLTSLEFPTLPEPVWPNTQPASTAEVLLVTNPLKPLGRWLSLDDIRTLKAWLAASEQRRLVLDAVYTFDTSFHPSTLELLETGQTLLLHSLTKGWLQPRLFGIAFVPESDATDLIAAFRSHPPPQSHLARARELMTVHAGMPAAIALELSSGFERLVAALPPNAPMPNVPIAPSYLFPVGARWSELLEHSNVLGIPANVFGSPRKEITILSSLSFLI